MSEQEVGRDESRVEQDRRNMENVMNPKYRAVRKFVSKATLRSEWTLRKEKARAIAESEGWDVYHIEVRGSVGFYYDE